MEKDKEFLAKSVEAAKSCGWNVDYIEVEKFVTWVHDEMDEPVPDLEPYCE